MKREFFQTALKGATAEKQNALEKKNQAESCCSFNHQGFRVMDLMRFVLSSIALLVSSRFVFFM